MRGHVSIDNLRMSNCFADSPRKDSCSTSQIKCNESRIPVCIENVRICDLVDDCDESEDELLNCGEFISSQLLFLIINKNVEFPYHFQTKFHLVVDVILRMAGAVGRTLAKR